MTIPLTQGKFAVIDDEDFVFIGNHKWHAVLACGKWYAARSIFKSGTYRKIFMHREILKHHLPHTDHADGDGLNNSKSNLRACYPHQNGSNRLNQKNTSGFKGVHKNQWKRWYATIKVRGKHVNLGTFDDPISAAKAYDRAAVRYFGEFAKTNKQQGVL